MSKAESRIPFEKLELYEKLIATTMPFTSFNGHMFSFLTANGKLALRLSAQDREAFLAKYKTKLMEQHGTALKEYVTVPDTLLKNTRQLAPHFADSLAYVKTLKAKPTKPRK